MSTKTISLSTQTASRQMAADMAHAEAAKIGAAAERKQRREQGQSIEAILTSDDKGGKAIYWRRKVGRDGEAVEVERSGAYTERAFLRMAEKAAGQAGRGRWNRPEAVEAVAAELVARTMAKTGGRMPKRGTLGREHEGHENPDLAYLTSAARHLIASANRGEASGLLCEAAPIGDADQDQGMDLSLAELMGEAEAAAEGPRDPYLAEPAEDGADLLNPQVRAAAETLADLGGERPAAVKAAIAATLRSPLARSADLADAGYASSPASARKAKQRGGAVLKRLIGELLAERMEKAGDPDAELSTLALTFAHLCENEDGTGSRPHPMEGAPHKPYRRPNIEWPLVTPHEEIPPTIYTAPEPDWRTV